jgi:hypothetical protein
MPAALKDSWDNDRILKLSAGRANILFAETQKLSADHQ